ncbi:hypothetical protein FQN54_006582 [Arachnomyces sp. PD_36]|nr:hypothetical protein FQN54_006582 [Arachnomyces sp. PD_36]
MSAASTTSTTSTPSPSAPNVTSASQSTTTSRRPARKSTLTQQQKNQKRQRATQDQLTTLELEFNKNPTPTAAVRERIAQDINMTERSVQIWFQNRRAKIKMIAKKSIETGEDCDSIPESMRQYLAMQYDPTKPQARNLFGRAAGIGYGSNGALLNENSNSSKVLIHHFSCRSLSIGTWRRVGQNTMDLVIFYSPDKACMTYYINNDSAGYKIEYPFSHIKNISLESGESAGNPSGAPPRPGGLVVELNRPPNFYMDSSNSGGFYQCGDFTEDQQATQIFTHHLGGHPKVLSVQLAKLVSLESFQNRMAPFDFGHGQITASAPVSPHLHRPASQPNHIVRPHMGTYQENHYGMNLQPGRMGHKRQRSRSVPVAVDFSAMGAPMPSFHVQHPSQQFTPDPNIFAPIPQHHAAQGPLGPNLRINTSSGYDMAMGQYPMSAATTGSPSEYASPSFFTTSAPDQTSSANFTAPYSLPFLSPSPMVEQIGTMPHSASPLSNVSHADPVIADQSPPLSTIPRSSSADMFSMQPDHANMSDDGLLLSEMYSKQNLNLPGPSPPGMDDSNFNIPMHDMQDHHEQNDTIEFPNMMSFDTVDPNSLGAES